MNYQLHELNSDNDRIWLNPCRKLSRRSFFLSAAILMGFVFILINLSEVEYYQHYFEKTKVTRISSFHSLVEYLKKMTQLSRYNDLSGEDLKLYQTLEYRAK